ncbi:NAD(P)-binding protein [Guyanagaster necrorhizus]|uniref:NAD(P)-binding protein n=1 Tax=Guyanagaster necrorhizus TaxID=856835 RepID=A0A9P8AQ19_9AGAR|nr:NAD(P)-binding protein [Guyanagaster necrorhizus MCA 3950]KAG7443555.1 NAD(P)-binding protein [Guyanagaster necrorhizus MCA 3950]
MTAPNDQYKRVILVTGSNTGIGYDIVRLLAEKGHTVYLASRKESAGKEAQAKLKKDYNLDVKFVQLDITDEASVKAAKETIEKAEGRLDTLVNNAGILCVSYMSESQLASTVSLTTIRNAFEPNFYGLIQTTQAFLPLLRAAPKGYACVVNNTTDMASNAHQAAPGSRYYVAYDTSKAAANSYSIALAKELEKEDIKVNVVTPGFTTTKLNNFLPGGKTTEDGASVLVPWALLGPEDKGKTCLFWSYKGEFPW